MNQTTVEAGGTIGASTILDPHTQPLESGGGRPELMRPEPQSTELTETGGLPARSRSFASADPSKGKDGPRKPVSVRETLDSEKARLDSEEVDRKAKDAAEAAKVKAGEREEEQARGAGKAATVSKDPVTGKATGRGASERAATGQDVPDERESSGLPARSQSFASAEAGRKHTEPPARFLPEARTKWANVPNEVKAEVHRLSKEYEGEIDKHRQAAERYQGVKRFDDIARANGRELKDTLNRIVAVEQALARSPIAGLEMILREVGPRKADGSHLSLHEIAQAVARQTPQQFAQALQSAVQQPTQRPAQRPGGQQHSPDSPWRSLASAEPGVRAMAQEVRSMRIELAASRLEPMLNAFAAAHPDYHALEERIAGVLTSGVIDKLYGTGLTPEQRLSEAYRMAGGTASPSRSEPPAPSAHSSALPARSRSFASVEAGDTAPPVHPEAGKKSVRGAPNGGEDTVAERPKQSIRDLLKSEMRSIAGG